MAVLQIARIQVRRGQENVTGIPQLESGEFGWAVDTQKLYIGNGSIEEGAPYKGNTEILTEHTVSSIFTLPTYTYVGHTTLLNLSSTVRTIQSKLDDFVSIYDFGNGDDVNPLGNGVVDVSNCLQTAIDQIFLNSNKTDPASRVALRIPAGVYVISQTIFLPTNATLIGDGQGKTVLRMVANSTPIIQFCDQDSVSGNYNVFPYIGDSGKEPRNINLIGLTFEYDSANSLINQYPLVLADCAIDCYIVDCKFTGSYVVGSSTSDAGYCGIEIRGQVAMTTRDLLIQNCTFENLYYGIKSNYDSEDTIIENCRFKKLNRGISYSETAQGGNYVGPVRTKISNSKFYEIEKEGFYVGAIYALPTFHSSAYNTFKEVGNDLNGDFNAVYPIINYQTSGNTSDGDYFDRFENINSTSTEVLFVESIQGNHYTDNHKVYTANIVANDYVRLFRLPLPDQTQKYTIPYSAFWDSLNISRKGELSINVATFSSLPYSPEVSVTDNYSYIGSDLHWQDDFAFVITTNTATSTINVGLQGANDSGIISYRYTSNV